MQQKLYGKIIPVKYLPINRVELSHERIRQGPRNRSEALRHSKLVMAAARTWRRLKGENHLPMVVEGVRFADGVAITATPTEDAA